MEVDEIDDDVGFSLDQLLNVSKITDIGQVKTVLINSGRFFSFFLI